MKRKWLRAIFLMMLGGACFFGVNPKDIEDLLHIMNETKVEFTIPDEDPNGDSGPDGYRSLIKIKDAESEMPPGFRSERLNAECAAPLLKQDGNGVVGAAADDEVEAPVAVKISDGD